MSKELEKFKKEWAALQKQLQAVRQDYAAFGTNRQHHQAMVREGTKQIGRDVQKAKDGGATGTELKDFLKDKEVLSSMKTVMDALAALAKEEVRLKGILSTAGKLGTAMTKLSTEIAKEVTKREKKENRALFAKESKSLPDMKKLSSAVATERVDFLSDTVDQEQINKWSAARDRKDFDKDVAAEIKKTKSDRKASDDRETDGQAMNMRIFPKAVTQVKKLYTVGVAQLKEAAKAAKEGNREAASDAIGQAQEALKQIKAQRLPISRQMKKFNKYDIMRMKDDKDGKVILKGAEDMEKQETDLAAMIKKVARVTV